MTQTLLAPLRSPKNSPALEIAAVDPKRQLTCEEEVLTLSGQDDFYWGEIPQERMDQLLDLAAQEGWQQAVEKILVPEFPRQVGMVTNPSRADWLRLLPRQERLVALDVGSGWGQVARLLAQEPTNQVYSIEKIASRARFQAIRKRQEAIDNLSIINAGLSEVKFPQDTFDLVSFVGVLEWVGTADAPKDPRDVQLEALQQVHAALRPGGVTVIGIENRIGFNCFLGGKDHSGLRFTSLMPRWLANRWVSWRTPRYRSNRDAQSYRTYTYSARGYKQLLAEAGFSKVEVFVSHPHYGYPLCLIENENSKIRRFFGQHYQPNSARDAAFAGMFRALGWLGVAHFFPPHFVVLAQK